MTTTEKERKEERQIYYIALYSMIFIPCPVSAGSAASETNFVVASNFPLVELILVP